MKSKDRIAEIWKSNINDLLDSLEDPEKMARQFVRDMEEEVDQAAASVAAAVANERRLKREHSEHQARVQEWQRKAEGAIEAGDEALARQALERKGFYGRAATELVPALEESREVATQLRQQLHQFKAHLRQARSRQGALVARYQAARRRGEEVQSRDGTADAASAFARLEERICAHEGAFEQMAEQVEIKAAEADVQRELAEEGRQVERHFKALEAEERVEEELAALKARISKNGQEAESC